VQIATNFAHPMQEPMKWPITVGYLTEEDPLDRRTWSGTNHFLLRALEDRVQAVRILGPVRPQPALFLCRLMNQVLLRTTGQRFNYRASFRMARAFAKALRNRLAGLDLIIAPAGMATTALLPQGVPVVYINDRCLAGALDYHSILTGLAAFSRREGLAVEEQAFQRAALVVFSSHWAAEAAKAADPQVASKLAVIPFGANLEVPPPPPSPRSFPGTPLKLLMIGVNWEEKGGPVAYRTLQALKARGHAAQLVVCGCMPPLDCDDPDLVREGFLDKNVPADRARLEEHLRTADLLLLPTRFEAFGIVFCEAAAFGIPVLASNTGGIPTPVLHGTTGWLFGMDADGQDYADRIEQLMKDPEKWQDMRAQARARYEAHLNWPAFVEDLLQRVQAEGLSSNAR
jgi:glycosyltransferase involved in cell wall biosynthesis